MIPTITLAELLTQVGQVSTAVTAGITPYVLLAIGFPLAFYVIKKVIALIPKSR